MKNYWFFIEFFGFWKNLKNIFFDFFLDLKKYYFSGLKKKVGHSFDVKNCDLSVSEHFRAILGLLSWFESVSLKQLKIYLFFVLYAIFQPSISWIRCAVVTALMGLIHNNTVEVELASNMILRGVIKIHALISGICH